MRPNHSRKTMKTITLAIVTLLLIAGMSYAQNVSLTAQRSTVILPDGQVVPMWGLFCGAATNATCTALNGTAQTGSGWQPPLITVTSGTNLTITLANNLPAPTSLVIVGQLGGGLGDASQRTTDPASNFPHGTQTTQWPIAGSNPPAPGDPTFNPPDQGPRVRSFATEVPANTSTGTQLPAWKSLRPGTYLIESGTHPSIQGPMGLYGVLRVVDASAANAAYPGLIYDTDVPVLLSEIDPAQNLAVELFAEAVAGCPTTYVGACAGAISATQETTLWVGGPTGCGAAHACYPPAVNYDPRYYLINGIAFDKTNIGASSYPVAGTAATGNVLLRFVNAGLRMHVPSVVGLNMSLIAEDGNVLPGTPRVQNEVFLPAGKTYDVMVKPGFTGALPSGAYTASSYAIFDRQLSLSTNNQRDGGMLAYLLMNGGSVSSGATASARPDSYSLVPGKTLSISDPAKGVIANDTGVYGVQFVSGATGGTLALNADGTFTYVPNAGTTSDSFVYQANGNSALTATVTLAAAAIEPSSGITLNNDSFTSNVATTIDIKGPGVLANDIDAAGYPLSVDPTSISTSDPITVVVNADGSFVATTGPSTAARTFSFTYRAKNSQGTASASAATVTLSFPGASGLAVSVRDAKTHAAITDYRWIIEEDRTFRINSATQVNTGTNVPSLGTSFHTSYMPVVASGCVGTVACESGQTLLGQPAVCDVGNGVCRNTASQQTPLDPSAVHLDPTKYYYISILPGDAANPFNAGFTGDPSTCGTDPNAVCGHDMSGAPIAAGQLAVTVTTEPTPKQPAQIAVFVFEDDWPLNGENDAGGGVDVLAVNEPGLGGFEITLLDQAGGFGDSTGQPTYDMFNMPLSNSLVGTPDPVTGNDACPITKSKDGLVGMIVTCPKYESDGKTLSPLAGQALIKNLYPGLYEVVATPGADRIARGEQWLQTNTLDGTKPHEAFIKSGEPAYFQEFGPAGFHVMIGFANPAIINSRLSNVQAGCISPCSTNNSITGRVTTVRISRSPDERLYSSESYDANSYTQCYVSLGDPDAEDFEFTPCNPDGSFTFNGVPDGNWRVTVFDQWNDLLVDGLSFPVAVNGGKAFNFGDFPMQQWRTNLATRSFIDLNGDGVSNVDGNGNPLEPGLPLVPTNVRFRDGSYSNFNNTDLNGFAGFNEIFPFFNWLVLEADTTRYKQTGVHVVYDAGGPADCTVPAGFTPTPPCSNIANHLAGTHEAVHLPTNLRFPGAVYCDNADCNGFSIANGPGSSAASPSTGRIDPPWVTSEAWQGFIGNYEFMEFGKKPYAAGENGGIKGHVIYASTRPFDDPALLLQLSWEPMVPNVTINLYQKSTAPDGTDSLKLVDTTKTTSWDDWAQGFRVAGTPTTPGIPNMNCPGQATAGEGSLFFFTLSGSQQWLNPGIPLASNSQFKCYDGMLMFNQVQPAPYDGMYQFPSVTSRDPVTGKPTGTNCTICISDPDTTDPYANGVTMLPAGKYVVEVVVPPGYELVKEEDKNILIGDNYVAPATQQFGGLGSIFILPDQAAIGSTYNAYNHQNSTTDLGVQPRHEGDTGSVEQFWPCVGAARIVPDFISLYPGSAEVAPFAGATRNLCDRKEVTLEDQSSVLAKFYIFSSTHVAAHYAGIITDDFASEFDPFAPTFGEKFAVPNLPISFKDFNGVEISRSSSDQFGFFDGLTYSTWEVNPPNPTGYAPQVMVSCMNDPGPVPGPNGTLITDPLYNSNYSQFCYEWSFMPGQTAYMDTPVIPTAAFAEGYNPVDCAYPDATPAIASVLGDSVGGGAGPWVSAAGHTLTINALAPSGSAGIQVQNNAYSGPSATAAPFNQKFVTRHYGFGSRPSTCPATGNCANVTIAGVPMTNVSWSDSQITGTVPTIPQSASNCTIPQRTTPASVGNSARCGQLIITAANGKQSIDTVTITVAGKAPTYVNGENASNNAIQHAIDVSSPGDLIIIGPGTYYEVVLMWKPVRLQGVGAASVTINANAHPAGKMDPWRHQVACLFGLAQNGQPISTTNTDTSCQASMRFQVDRIPLEGIVGWDTTLNGNLAELLQEPTLMGAYEGAGITVLGKGVRFPNGSDPFGTGAEAGFPDGTVFLGNNNRDCNQFVANFLCNPSRIDGLTITNSSQGGGGIFVHGWNHYLEVSNNRIHSNAGTISGGLTVGLGEFPEPIIVGDPDFAGENIPARPVPPGTPNGTQLPYLLQTNTWVHNNSITQNASLGDELFSATPAGGGGVTFCTGSDYYQFNNNWVCGNLSTGDGGGVVHLGLSYNGNISHNAVVFNQSFNPTIPTNGGGVLVMGAAPDGITLVNGVPTECGTTTDVDCPPAISDGTGPGLVIDANLLQGNSAESGTGGGLRLQTVNGAEVSRFPSSPNNWYGISVTNNIIANNVAGWDGGGVSLQDALRVSFVNNTVISNDTTASSGVLFNTLGASQASVPPPGCNPSAGAGCTNPVTTSTPQVAGLASMPNTSNLTASLPSTLTCPAGFGYGSGATLVNGTCRGASLPLLRNDLFWQNRAFNITVTQNVASTSGNTLLNQQNLVTLVPSLSQTSTGQCPTTGVNSSAGPSYWDIGVRGDTGAGNHNSGFTLTLSNSILTSFTGGYSGNGNLAPSSPGVVSQYCNGARVPPENGGLGFTVPPGISDATLPNPVFNLTPSATVDEGNNWVNLSYGPLTLTNFNSGADLGNYAIVPGSPAFNSASVNGAPNHDYFGTTRPQGGGFDIGAVELVAAAAPVVSITGGPLNFGNVVIGTRSASQQLTLHNTGNAPFTQISLAFSSSLFARPTGTGGGTCGTTLGAGANCTINVVFQPTSAGLVNATLTITGNTSVTGSPISLSGTGTAPVISASLSPSTWSPSATRGVTLTGPMQTFILTNAGNVTLTGIAQGALGGSSPQDYTVVRLLSTCGPAGNGQLLGQTTLAPGASCAVTVQFRPRTIDPAGSVRNATISVSDAAGTQTSTLSGTAQ
jgi:hypothetical protein